MSAARTIGSRIRVILGDDGNSWLLLLDDEDGNSKWQSKNWKSVPIGLANRMNTCMGKERDIQYVDFGPDDSWYVHHADADGSDHRCRWSGLDSEESAAIEEWALQPLPCKIALGSQNSLPSLCVILGTNGYQCFNTSTHLSDRLNLNHSRGGTVHMIRLFCDGQYYIKDDTGTQWVLSNDNLGEELYTNNSEVEELAVAGNGSWIVIRSDYFVTSADVDTELYDLITAFFWQQFERTKSPQDLEEYHIREIAQRAAHEEEWKRREEEERAEKAAEESKTTTVEELTQEKESIDELEAELEELQDGLYSRKKSLRESLVALPPAQRPQWNLGEDKQSTRQQEKPLCVICRDEAPVQAVVPCGHLCLCDDCASSISQRPSNDRLCPLCRGPAPSTLRIYW